MQQFVYNQLHCTLACIVTGITIINDDDDCIRVLCVRLEAFQLHHVWSMQPTITT